MPDSLIAITFVKFMYQQKWFNMRDDLETQVLDNIYTRNRKNALSKEGTSLVVVNSVVVYGNKCTSRS
jgi:hypothetical protein